MDASDIDLDLDPNFEPQTRARSNTWPLRPSRELESQSSPVNGDESSNGIDQHGSVKDPLGLTAKKCGSRRNAWGNLSYADLITKAIQSSPEKRLTLSQIYDWMVQNVPYFKDKGDSTSSAGWKNSIRHNLSLHSRFMRIQNEGTGKSSWWVLNPDAKPGKTPRRRAGSMETKSYEKKRGRVRKKVEALRAAMENGGSLSPGGSDDYLDALNFENFRPRASSNASSCGRLSPIHAVAEPDLHDNQVPPMSPIPWGAEVTNSSNLYIGDGYSDLVDSLVDGMKLTNQENLKMDMRDPYISGASREFNGQSSSFMGVDSAPSGLDNQYNHLPAPPPYPKQQQQQMNGLDYPRQDFNNLRLQHRSSPVTNGSANGFTQSNLYNEEYNEAVMSIKQEAKGLFSEDYNDVVMNIKQEAKGMSPVRLAAPSALSVNTQQQLNSPDRSQQGSPNTGTYNSHLSPQPQSGLVNGQHSLTLLNCQVSPQQGRHLAQQQQQNITTATLQQQQALQQASILREALTRGSYRHPSSNTPSPTYSPMGNHSPLGPTSNMNNGLLNISMTLNSDISPNHQSLTSGQLRVINENFTDNHFINSNGMGGVCNNNPGMPLDIDMELISGLDYDMDQVIKQELTLEGNLDFNFEAGQNVVH
ncbi:unnamed protein product [Lymnaea stagnalis]|uniref:Forkhead box protein O n=1 Tax=Lymnaea stagnalis TaxID=6523 RepID=A0AAV2HLA3_LYMST